MRRSLVALFAVLALWCPSAALAKAGGTDRPIRSRDIGGIGTLNLSTGTFSSDATEIVSHLGKTRSHNVGTFVVTGPGTFAASFSFTQVTPSGDELTGVVHATGTFTAAGSEGTFVATFTGGTGRFADASGGTTGSLHTTTISSDGVTVVQRTTSEGTGHISY